MPATSKAQQALAALDLKRARAGKKTRTGMSVKELKKYAKTKTSNLPEHVAKRKMGDFGGKRRMD